MLVPDYTCANCGGRIGPKRIVYVHDVQGSHWRGIALLRCEVCNRSYEKPISMMVLDDEEQEEI